MKGGKPNCRWIAGLTVVSFLWAACFFVISSPLAAASAGKADKRIERSDDAGSGVVEKTGDAPAVGGKRKFPWLLVAAGTVVVGVAVYFALFHKPKCELMVEVGEGVTGTPAAGSVKYKKGTVVSYSFDVAAGYKNVTVTLDGRSAAPSGTVTMDKARRLTATAVPLALYSLSVEMDEGVTGTPASGTHAYTEGTLVNYEYSLKAGFCNLVVKRDGETIDMAAMGSESGSFLIQGNTAITVTSDSLLETGFDIRGIWRINWPEGESTASFAGTSASGEFRILDGVCQGVIGTYTVAGQVVAFAFPYVKQSPYLFIYQFNGIMQASDRMGGSCGYESDPLWYPLGPWTGTRIE